MSRVVVLISAGIVQCVHVCLLKFVRICLCVRAERGLSVVDVGVRAMTGHGSARCGLRRLWSLCPIKADLQPSPSLDTGWAALYQEHTLPGIPFKNIFNRWVNQGEKKAVLLSSAWCHVASWLWGAGRNWERCSLIFQHLTLSTNSLN